MRSLAGDDAAAAQFIIITHDKELDDRLFNVLVLKTRGMVGHAISGICSVLVWLCECWSFLSSHQKCKRLFPDWEERFEVTARCWLSARRGWRRRRWSLSLFSLNFQFKTSSNKSLHNKNCKFFKILSNVRWSAILSVYWLNRSVDSRNDDSFFVLWYYDKFQYDFHHWNLLHGE